MADYLFLQNTKKNRNPYNHAKLFRFRSIIALGCNKNYFLEQVTCQISKITPLSFNKINMSKDILASHSICKI